MVNIECPLFFFLTKYILFFFIIILLQSCASTSGIRLEGNDFKENLPGRWEGTWQWGARSGEQRITISKIDGNKVQLTGFSPGNAFRGEVTEVYGRIENSTLLLTWPEKPTEEKYEMKRDDSNNLILDGYWYNPDYGITGGTQFKKIVGGSNID